jgi:hypothetical protein
MQIVDRPVSVSGSPRGQSIPAQSVPPPQRAMPGVVLGRDLPLVLALAFSTMASEGFAQAPLNVQQLMARSQQWQFSAGLDHRSLASDSGPEQWSQGLSSVLRYGLSPRFEINAAYRSGLSKARGRTPAGEGFQTSNRFASIELGANWLLRGEDRWPALLFETRVVTRSERDGQAESLSGLSVAATTYRSIDPVVLSLRVAYTDQRGSRQAGQHLEPGASWRLEPLVNFAVNPRVTLIGGLALGRESDLRINGERQLTQRYPMALRLGLGFAPAGKSTVFLMGDLAGSGSASGVSLRWFRDF